MKRVGNWPVEADADRHGGIGFEGGLEFRVEYSEMGRIVHFCMLD